MCEQSQVQNCAIGRVGGSTNSADAVPTAGSQLDINEATKSYEVWPLTSATVIHQKHLLRKHEKMKKDLFAFFRATFYRWTQLWPNACAEFTKAPMVLSLWRSACRKFRLLARKEGRLAWGVNDFDEAFPLPYTNDLVRLAAGALLAIAENQIALKTKEACEAILAGYM